MNADRARIARRRAGSTGALRPGPRSPAWQPRAAASAGAARATGPRLLELAGRFIDVLLVVVIAIGLTGVVLGRLLPAAEHPVYIVAGPSMGEALPVGSAVVLDQVAPDDLVPGDIVTLQSGPQRAVFTHRIVRIVERDGATWIETRGDANPTADPSITPASAVVGRVAVAIPEAGYVLMLLSTIQGVVLILAVGGLLLALGWWLGSLADEWAVAAARGAVRASATSR